MVDTSKDAGIIQVLVDRLESQRLPRVLSLKASVDKGEPLAELDIHFLEEIFQDAQHIQPLVDRHPEWQSLVAKVIHLYKEITDKALENEKARNQRT